MTSFIPSDYVLALYVVGYDGLTLIVCEQRLKALYKYRIT